MKTFLILALAVAASNAAYIKNRGPVRALPGIHGRIVGGDDAAPGEFKYQVSWQSRSGFNSCGGSVLNKDYVLTAAHCCAGVSSSYSIVAGEYNVDENDGTEQRVEIQRRIRHPDYDSSTVDNDVCVLHLADSLEFNDAVGPVTLDRTGGQTEPEDFIVTGWGTLSSGGSLPSILQKVTVPFVDEATCKDAYGSSSITDGMICAGRKGKDSCQGDSGGPMVNMNGEQVGIVSWGYGCAAAGYPGVYTRVSNYASWIENHSRIVN